MSEWKIGKLSDIAEIIMGQSPEGSTCSSTIRGLPLLNGPTEFTQKYPRAVQYTIDPKKVCQIGDILFCVRGSTTGRMNWSDQAYAIGRGLAAIRHKKGLHLNSFLRAALELALPDLLVSATGSTFPNVSRNDLLKISIYVPPLEEQTAIAEVLSTLDDKIDLLHRHNKTLEQMAEALFRQWFVEEVDDNWEVKSLVDLATYTNGLALQKYPPKNEAEVLPVIKIREMNQGITENSDLCSANVPEPYIVHDGDILFSWSGSLDVIVWTGGKGALNQHLFKVTSNTYPSWLVYFSTRYFLDGFRDIAADKATTMGHIQRRHLVEAQLRLPNLKMIRNYGETIQPLFDKKVTNSIQIRTITALRDTLLPKLMDGTVRVSP